MNKTSIGEEKIIRILRASDIKFEREKSFKDLKFGYYRYDFYIPLLKILIEYDGAGHFKFIKKFYKKHSDFNSARERDRRKNNYALAHDIKLYRIPFWELDNINSFDDMLNEKFLVHSMWHNDNLKVPKN